MNGSKETKYALIKEMIYYVLGVCLIVGFVYLYWTRFVDQDGIPLAIQKLYRMGKYYAFIVNSVVFLLFLIFVPYKSKISWRSKGTLAAFILALFAEMFGIPLLIYILSPFVSSANSVLYIIPGKPPIDLYGHFFIFGMKGVIIGSYMTLIGMILVFAGWKQIHKSNGLVTNGLYKYIRHPQYTGLFLVITGWILHWANILTLIMYPILVIMYFVLSRKEEKELAEQFGKQYKDYALKTSMFFPINIKKELI